MKHVSKSVLLFYTASEMYGLVTAIADYPQFLPWCDKAEVLESDAQGVTAKVGLAFAGVHHSFTTRNEQVPARSVQMQLVDGPFSVLKGEWQFQPLGEHASKVEFDLQYAFASGALERVLSPVFDRVASSLVDAFVQRARQVYGER